jgi:hypothetical protein
LFPLSYYVKWDVEEDEPPLGTLADVLPSPGVEAVAGSEIVFNECGSSSSLNSTSSLKKQDQLILG